MAGAGQKPFMCVRVGAQCDPTHRLSVTIRRERLSFGGFQGGEAPLRGAVVGIECCKGCKNRVKSVFDHCAKSSKKLAQWSSLAQWSGARLKAVWLKKSGAL